VSQARADLRHGEVHFMSDRLLEDELSARGHPLLLGGRDGVPATREGQREDHAGGDVYFSLKALMMSQIKALGASVLTAPASL
jgi:hypothetical protein